MMTSGGSAKAQRALELLLGPENIRRAVALVLAPGSEPGARNIANEVLRYVRSLEATELAYAAYKRSVDVEDAEVERLLTVAEAHPSEHVRAQAAQVRETVRLRRLE